MTKILVLQSHRDPLPYAWLNQCLQSVQSWAEQNQYDYLFIGDEIFETISVEIRQKTKQQKVITSDLARLIALQNYLTKGYQTVIWCDADFLIFAPNNFTLPESSYSLGREVWVQQDKRGNLKAYKKIHNAFMMFKQGNSFLNFYTDTARQLIEMNTGTMPPQFIGPKLLTALHNIIQCPVMETAGMLSPLVIQDLINGGGAAVDLFNKNSSQIIAGANLCSSLTTEEENRKITSLIELLLKPDQISFKVR